MREIQRQLYVEPFQTETSTEKCRIGSRKMVRNNIKGNCQSLVRFFDVAQIFTSFCIIEST